MQPEEFHYEIPWRASGLHPGHHRSSQSGGGFEFRGFAGLLDAPDPRRFDIRASLRDPFERIWVRVYSQRSAIPVYAIADLSASMGFRGHRRKLDGLADFVASLGYSAYRTGDPFSFIGCDTAVRDDFVQPLTRAKGVGVELARRLRRFDPAGRHARGLLDASRLLAKRRGLVFLASDFHFPLELLELVLAALSRHTVVPVVFWDRAEFEDLPRFGLARIRDAETGQQRSLLMRSSLRKQIRRAFLQRRKALENRFVARGSPPLFVIDDFDPDAVTRFFYG